MEPILFLTLVLGSVVSAFSGRQGFAILIMLLSFPLFFGGGWNLVGFGVLAVWVWAVNFLRRGVRPQKK